jgi:hypothetical protein
VERESEKQKRHNDISSEQEWFSKAPENMNCKEEINSRETPG